MPKTSTEEVSQSVYPTKEEDKPANRTNEKVFHTPIVNDKKVTKNRSADATNDDEVVKHDFSEMLDMDTLYGAGGLPYPFDNETSGDTKWVDPSH